MHLIRQIIIFSAFGLFSLEAMEAPHNAPIRPGVYISEIDNQTDEHMSVCGYEAESDSYSCSRSRRYIPKYDRDGQPIMLISKTVCPGQKFTQLIPIKMSEPLIDGNYNYLTSVAHIRIKSTDCPANDQYFWLYKVNKKSAMDFLIQARNKSFRCNFSMHEESVTSDQPNSLYTLIKVIIEKSDCSGMKMISQTVAQLPEQISESSGHAGRRIKIIRKK